MPETLTPKALFPKALFPTAERLWITLNGVRQHAEVMGSGPPLLLLHGFPQTHAMWHRVAPALAEAFTLVMPDLRGYGDSGKIEGETDHATFCKRTMAADALALMRHLGFETFAAAGHDRGGRVVHRLCLDAPAAVSRAAVLDIVPTHTIFATMGAEVALAYYHWLFLAQPRPLPEKLIAADPTFYLNWTLGAWGTGLEAFAPQALAEYRRCFADPGTIHAMCEDYRAAATIDLVHDEADLGERIQCPLLVMWGRKGLMETHYDVPQTWRHKALTVEEAPIDAGHFLAEEAPEAVAAALLAFLRA